MAVTVGFEPLSDAQRGCASSLDARDFAEVAPIITHPETGLRSNSVTAALPLEGFVPALMQRVGDTIEVVLKEIRIGVERHRSGSVAEHSL